jgi:hypothetical protein
VFVVGSQAILASMPDAPEIVRESPEIDAFPKDAKLWELTEAKLTQDGVEPIASEHIEGLFGSKARFHQTHGFFIDGSTKRQPSYRKDGLSARFAYEPKSKSGS